MPRQAAIERSATTSSEVERWMRGPPASDARNEEWITGIFVGFKDGCPVSNYLLAVSRIRGSAVRIGHSDVAHRDDLGLGGHGRHRVCRDRHDAGNGSTS